MTEKHKKALAAGRKRAAAKRAAATNKSQRRKVDAVLKPGTYHATIQKVENLGMGRFRLVARVRGKGLGSGGRLVDVAEPPIVVEKVAEPMQVTEELVRDASAAAPQSPTYITAEKANDLFVGMIRARATWLRELDLYDNIDARHEDFMHGQQKIHTAFSNFLGAVSAYRHCVCENGDITE